MISYSQTNVFTGEELSLLHKATALVEKITDDGSEIRCHELARAVGEVLQLEVADGQYGFVEHSWLWTTSFPKDLHEGQLHGDFPNILDVYSVGQLPIVRLVSCDHPQLPHLGWGYRPSFTKRTDIRHSVVSHLVREMTRRRYTSP